MAALEEQLRFNLSVPPDPANMSTRFKLRPAPVILHKLSPPAPVAPPPLSLSLQARMELASRLARRELQTALLMKNATLLSKEPIVFNNVRSAPVPPPKCPPTQDATKSNLAKSNLANHQKSKFKRGGVKHVTIAMTEGGPCEEAKQLRDELTQQLHCYRLSLPRPAHETVVLKSDSIGGSGRLEWVGEMNKERKIIERRTEEQHIRNIRLLYQLKQKIKEAERAMSKVKEGADFVKKSHAVQQLAGAHRTALRTLHSLTNTASNGTDPKVTHQLISLLELLARISSQSDDGFEDTELLEGIKGLRESLVDHFAVVKSASVAEERKIASLKSHDLSTVAKPSGKKRNMKQRLGFKPKSVILKRNYTQGGHGHGPKSKVEEKKTFNRTNGVSPSFTKKRENKVALKERRDEPLSLSAPPPPPPPASDRTENVENVSRSHFEKEVTRHMWYNAKLTESVRQLDSTQKETLGKLSELEERVKEMKEQKPPPPLTEKREDRGTQMTPEINEKSTCFSKDESTVQVSGDEGKGFLDRTAVRKMMERLDEIEKEKTEIQRRWQSVSYDDPLTSSRETSPSPPPLSSSGFDSSKTLAPLSAETVDSILRYQELYKNYLKTTGIDTEGDFNPWSMVDSICDELMEEMLTEVIGEVDSALDTYVHQLFDSEFHIP
ncbi:PREDICTED: uncharacterized protein LOC109580922 [Amphimedon queenslandica]|uniref:Uncharacterized protein n=1 Tax=Amphimedon queenslandica TaxID=400682 RepID=A0A1X7V9V7_AMPQE|nr:PREDICTED: uncharacterized protein LOC109580922 [Amphimedon queenslandica]|eukprot:XP_019850073.1 PREDICTED: uncharacterized protein LOC109580922 [Amphimedon queenslandica]